jgi:2-oxoglutarate ferredoxin oxidoreductase subunit gamma
MEREVLFTGIGGQGVQLAASVLARAAVAEGREVLLFGSYGGTMRGGPTDATLVVADAPISAPPIVSRAWSALAMHPAYWGPTCAKLVPEGVAVLNASLFEAPDAAGRRAFAVPATGIAAEQGSPLQAAMVLLGALVAVTELVSFDALCAGLAASLPERRRQHRERNERALRSGFDAVPQGAVPAWADAGGAA